MKLHLLEAIADSSRRAQAASHRYGQLLNDGDRRMLVQAFHRAESLARHALVDALDQVSEQYLAALKAQLADEDRHVDVFATWQQEAPPAVPAPRRKQRKEHVWFALLLANEVAGFCQFEMLSALLVDKTQQQQLQDIIRDETEHITRLARWLRPYRELPSFADVKRIAGRFNGDLEGRMQQFLPRQELAGFRREMGAVIRTLLEAAFGLD